MSKLIIYVSGRFATHGHRIRDFKWSVKHLKYIYEGRELTPEEFNAVFEKAFKYCYDLQPRVMVVELAPPAPAPVPVVSPATVANFDEITADAAEEVLARLRPDRLKKTPGRKPQLVDVA